MNVRVKILGAALLLLCAGCVRAQNLINGHEYVDLGLSVKWATCNVGASSPEEQGIRYPYGSSKPAVEKTIDEEYGVTSYFEDKDAEEGDTASINWGGTWRTPTKDEIEELMKKCDWVWTSQRGSNGYKITGPNGNSIFLPDDSYWSTTFDEDGFFVHVLSMDSESHFMYCITTITYNQLCVRPVSK